MDWKGSRIALSVITRDLIDPSPIHRFLDNARAHDHEIERVIVSYSHRLEEVTLQDLRNHVRIDALCAHDARSLQDQLSRLGLTPEAVEGLLRVPSWSRCREVPYGTYRNVALLHALLEGIDYLLFFDTDVEPRVLTDLEEGCPVWQETDFVGTHMECLAKPEVVATTSEYSGYYIIPPMRFEGFGDLLLGLGKGMVLEYMEDCHDHRCLNLGPAQPRKPSPTSKPLGGNLGLSLEAFQHLYPFFSTTYLFQDMCVKSRGEDTLLGQSLAEVEGSIMDVDLRVFHDTYIDFPQVPDIHRPPVRDRFYRACLGWIGRNPFMTWYLDRCNRLPGGLEEEIDNQRTGLEMGGQAAAGYLKDERFQELPQAFEASYTALPHAIDCFERLLGGWNALVEILGRGSPPSENNKDSYLPLAS